MLCATCKQEIADNAKFCRHCGATVSSSTVSPATKECPQCGAENTIAAKFCRVDGFRFEGAQPTATLRRRISRRRAQQLRVPRNCLQVSCTQRALRSRRRAASSVRSAVRLTRQGPHSARRTAFAWLARRAWRRSSRLAA